MKHAILAALALLGSMTVSAANITLTFTAAMQQGAPTNPVTGTIRWQAPSTLDAATAFTSIDLTIGGHSFTVPEIGMDHNQFGIVIGGTVSGVNNVSSQGAAPDFFIVWLHGAAAPTSFLYALPGQGSFGSVSFSQYSLTEDSAGMPEPASAGLVLAGGLAAAGFARRRRR
ncbi:MAG: PEP-CTERM sorting domain-containing protein [Acidobacteria bacterium]|nr:PEP-CTERM sorting domain-containing protein [Acidobacteriota bacterium]